MLSAHFFIDSSIQGFTLRTQIYGAESTQTILRTWGAFSRPPMPIYAVGIAQVPSVNTTTIRRLLRVDAGLSLVNRPQPMRMRKLLRDI